MTATAVSVRDGPILMSGPMVRATLEDRKTKTRRVVKPQPPPDSSLGGVGTYHPTVIRRGEEEPGAETFGAWWNDGEFCVRCPYGRPGDRLWVRETWWSSPVGPIYAATEARHGLTVPQDGRPRWKPSIHMPRWASRLTLEITAVHVERVQDISDEDVEAEGCKYLAYRYAREMEPCDPTEFSDLWDMLNMKRGHGWDTNPWVWVIGFRRLVSDLPHASTEDTK